MPTIDNSYCYIATKVSFSFCKIFSICYTKHLWRSWCNIDLVEHKFQVCLSYQHPDEVCQSRSRRDLSKYQTWGDTSIDSTCSAEWCLAPYQKGGFRKDKQAWREQGSTALAVKSQWLPTILPYYWTLAAQHHYCRSTHTAAFMLQVLSFKSEKTVFLKKVHNFTCEHHAFSIF